MKSFLLISVISANVFLSGCATFNSATNAPTNDEGKASINPQLNALTKAANKISAQLDQLIRLERGIPEKGVETANANSSLKTVLTVKWSGTGEDLVNGIAKQIGFKFIRSGTAPFTPIIVPLDGQDRTVETILRIVADRMSQIAEVRVSEKQKLIEIAYKRQ